MGGRGSGFKATGSGNEDNRQLHDDYSSGGKINDIKDPKDDITKRKNDIIDKLKHKRNIVVYKSTDDIEESFLNENLIALDNVLTTMKNEYKMSYKHLIGDGSNKRSSIRASRGYGYYAYVTRDSTGRFIMYLNKNMFEGQHGRYVVTEETRKDIKTGWSAKVPPDKMPVYTIVHELGHLIQFALIRAATQNKKPTEETIKDYAKQMRTDVINIAETRYKEKNNSVCIYASRNAEEWFAETFTSMHLNGVNSSGLTKALNDYLKGDHL